MENKKRELVSMVEKMSVAELYAYWELAKAIIERKDKSDFSRLDRGTAQD